MSEPDWKDALRRTVNAWVLGGEVVRTSALHEITVHVEAAYQRGLQAGRSQTGYSTRRKSKEGPCRTGTAVAAGSTPASPTGES
jgi:hypothetical protein